MQPLSLGSMTYAPQCYKFNSQGTELFLVGGKYGLVGNLAILLFDSVLWALLQTQKKYSLVWSVNCYSSWPFTYFRWINWLVSCSKWNIKSYLNWKGLCFFFHIAFFSFQFSCFYREDLEFFVIPEFVTHTHMHTLFFNEWLHLPCSVGQMHIQICCDIWLFSLKHKNNEQTKPSIL